jgi:hypothetical protein
METLQTLGKIIEGPAERDAIHIAVAPVVAGERLYPGQHIGLSNPARGIASSKTTPIGIVDPFLAGPAFPDQQFWLFLYPGSITSLRHEWTHSAFVVGGIDKEASRIWLEAYAQETSVGSIEKLIGAAKDWIEHEEYLCEGGRYEGVYTSDEFWPHFEVYTGIIVPVEKRDNFFTCSC